MVTDGTAYQTADVQGTAYQADRLASSQAGNGTGLVNSPGRQALDGIMESGEMKGYK
jgi:hypothetical protein